MSAVRFYHVDAYRVYLESRVEVFLGDLCHPCGGFLDGVSRIWVRGLTRGTSICGGWRHDFSWVINVFFSGRIWYLGPRLDFEFFGWFVAVKMKLKWMAFTLILCSGAWLLTLELLSGEYWWPRCLSDFSILAVAHDSYTHKIDLMEARKPSHFGAAHGFCLWGTGFTHTDASPALHRYRYKNDGSKTRCHMSKNHMKRKRTLGDFAPQWRFDCGPLMATIQITCGNA